MLQKAEIIIDDFPAEKLVVVFVEVELFVTVYAVDVVCAVGVVVSVGVVAGVSVFSVIPFLQVERSIVVVVVEAADPYKALPPSFIETHL